MNHIPEMIANILNYWTRLQFQQYLPNDIMSIISKYYFSDLILPRNAKKQLVDKNV